jgi:hypothetical protein
LSLSHWEYRPEIAKTRPYRQAALSLKHVIAVVEPKLHLHYPRAVLDVELGERALFLDLANAAHDHHLVKLGAVYLPRAVQVVLGRVLELLHGQRDKRLKALALQVSWLLKGGRIRTAHKAYHVRTNECFDDDTPLQR